MGIVRTRLVSALLAACAVTCIAADCAPGWHAYHDGGGEQSGGEGHDSCVRVFMGDPHDGDDGPLLQLTHAGAESVCWRHGAHLLTIRSPAAREGNGLLAVALRLTAGGWLLDGYPWGVARVGWPCPSCTRHCPARAPDAPYPARRCDCQCGMNLFMCVDAVAAAGLVLCGVTVGVTPLTGATWCIALVCVCVQPLAPCPRGWVPPPLARRCLGPTARIVQL